MRQVEVDSNYFQLIFEAPVTPSRRVIPALAEGANRVEWKPADGPLLKAITCIFASNKQDGCKQAGNLC
jgi:hypothetical protein